MRRISLVLPFLVVHASLLAAQAADPPLDSLSARRAGGVRYVETPDTATRVSAESFSELLAGQVPGLVVRRFGGAIGAGSRLELRGASSVDFGGQPLLVVDGVRAGSEEGSLFLPLGSTTVSSYDDLDPEMVESVTVLPGPAAAARYGPAAVNGVLEVRTRRGARGRPRWRAFAEAGVRGDPGGYPTNFQQVGRLAGGQRFPQCELQLQGAGLCTPVADSLLSYNPLEQSSPFRTGTRLGTGVSVDGGTGALSYAAGAGVERNVGVLEENDEERVNLRASVGVRPLAGVEARVWAAHLRRDLTLPYEGDDVRGVITAGLLGDGDPRVNEGYYQFFPRGENLFDATHDARRTMGGVEASWAALEWLRLAGRFGMDRADRDELLVLFEAGAPVFRETGERERQVRTGAVEAAARFRLSPSLESRTTLEVERVSERNAYRRDEERVGTELVAGFETRARRAVLGVSLRQGVEAGPFSVEAAVRRDEPRSQDELWSGSLAAAWTVGAPAPWLEGLTLRGAVGRSERSLTSAVGVDDPFLPALPICGLPECGRLGPQESREAEIGIDGRVLGRLDVRLTGYRRDDRDVLVVEPGFNPFQPGTEIRNTGAELSLRARVMERGRASWDVEVLGWANRNRVTGRPENSTAVLSGRTGQRIQEGRPLGAYFARPLLGFEDRDGDGIIEAAGCQVNGPECELELGDTAVYLGSATPTHGLTLASRLRLGEGVALSARVEHQGGARLLNAIEAYRCAFPNNCREAVDPSTPLADQARAAAAYVGFNAGYVEEADFVKLREVAVTLSAPSAWSRVIGAAGLDLTVAGRNLLTWTPYSGIDPEVNSLSRSSYEVWDFASQPLPRTVTTRVEVRF